MVLLEPTVTRRLPSGVYDRYVEPAVCAGLGRILACVVFAILSDYVSVVARRNVDCREKTRRNHFTRLVRLIIGLFILWVLLVYID